jgi:hypothetical protein
MALSERILRGLLVNTAPWHDTAPDVVVPAEPVPVVVTARFADGFAGLARGTAKAWTPRAVWVFFQHPNPDLRGAGYRVWLPIGDVTSDLSTLPLLPAGWSEEDLEDLDGEPTLDVEG